MLINKERSYSLLIGVGKRPNDSEAMAVSAADAQYLEKALCSFDLLQPNKITVLSNENATKLEIIGKLEGLAKQTNQEKADFILIFFSGHGSTNGKKYHLICRDSDSRDLNNSAIEGDLFVEKLNEINCDKMLVLLDCCHADGIANANIPFNEKPYLEKMNRVIITACAKDQKSYLSKPVSLFTFALIEGLGGKFLSKDDKDVNIFNLAMDVRERVVALSQIALKTKTMQQPQLNVLPKAGTLNFTLARYPLGGAQEIKLFKGASLQAYDGEKLNLSVQSVPDIEERNKYEWTSISNNIFIQDVKNSHITINFGGHVFTTPNEYNSLKTRLKEFGNRVIIYHDKDRGQQHSYTDLTKSTYDFLLEGIKFNAHLTKSLMYALQPRSAEAKQFLDQAGDGWESDDNSSNSAKKFIIRSYVGILGFQLRRLMAIGKEPLSSDKFDKYSLNCLITAKRTLQILTLSLISKLWALKTKHNFDLKDEYKKALADFFKFSKETDIKSEVHLLQILYLLFKEKHFEFPIPEIESLDSQLDAQNTEHNKEDNFINTCLEFESVNKAIESNTCGLETCFKAERLLSKLLEATAFLASYKMISIKEISYEELPYDPPSYFHNYAEIGLDFKLNMNVEKVIFSKQSVWTDAILLFKKEYQDSVNLFPFIIDLNALTFESGSKIYYYSYDDVLNSNLNYKFIEDDQIEENIKLDESQQFGNQSINALRSTVLKQLKFNNVYIKFNEAKRTILS